MIINRSLMLIVYVAFALTAFTQVQAEIPGLRTQTEKDVCDLIKAQLDGDGSCFITEWSDLHYKASYQINGYASATEKYSPFQSSSLSDRIGPIGGPIAGPITKRSWNLVEWTFQVSGSLSCDLDPNGGSGVGAWSCLSTVSPFKAMKTKSSCSCYEGGFSSCHQTTGCTAFFTHEVDGAGLIDQSSMNSSLRVYSETHLFR